MVLSCASSAEGSSRSSVGVASGGGHTPSQGEGPADSTQCVRVLFSPYSDWSSTGVCVRVRVFSNLSFPSDSGAAVYTVFVLGGSGTLTSHTLQPRPHEEAREGDDAPIILECHAHISWPLLRLAKMNFI